MILRVSIPSRVHLTLIDLGLAGYRRNGGVGFSIAAPRSTLAFAPHPTIDLRALTSCGYLPAETASLTKRLEQLMEQWRLVQGLRLADVQLPERHTGFGTGTAVALASLESLFLLNDRRVSPDFLRAHCGRGGASGIGLSSYFTGGFIFDAGRQFNPAPLVGSDATDEVDEPPLEMARIDLADWPMGVLAPPGVSAISPEQERAFFSRRLPLPAEDVFETTYHALFGSLAAVKSCNYDAFCASINALQRCAWKRSEIDLYGESVRACAVHLASIGCDAVAMSSIGPALIFWARDFDTAFAAAARQYGSSAVFRTRPDNTGRILSYD
ncbi:beta-ribofuranosylaminobenzene 5'-phosphate synthase family protein [Achromobacter xylosoxidans]|uniref:beta-ribofuranosylaminobenzene 5'-phosphate synthase family protein n=1 Tax=Alcaligenes xylosoxydans xylosoxydans TaxID=85698 RepID=UPI001EEEE802|nr:beta-ribofuranosylaminobenzene 5'-phosphate synthase family protein [Achromobacter xylosoxidans]